MPKSKTTNPPVSPDLYMVQEGSKLVFYAREGLMSFKPLGQVELGEHATPVYEAARKKKLRFQL